MPGITEEQIRNDLLEHIGESFDIDRKPVGMIQVTSAGEPFVVLFNPIQGWGSLRASNIVQLLADPTFPWFGAELPVEEVPPGQPPDGLGGGDPYSQYNLSPEEQQAYLNLSTAESGLYEAQTARQYALNELGREEFEYNTAISEREMALREGQFEYAQQQDAYANQLQQSMFQWQQQLDTYDAQLAQSQLGLQQQQYAGQYGLGAADLELQRQIAQQDALMGQQELGQRQYEFAQGLQQSPIDWIQAWQATRGMPFETGGQQFQMPGVTQPSFAAPQLPAWQNAPMPQASFTAPTWQGGGLPETPPMPTPTPSPAPQWAQSPQPVYGTGVQGGERLRIPTNQSDITALSQARGPLIAAVMRGVPGAREELDLLNEQLQQLTRPNAPSYAYNQDIMNRQATAGLPGLVASQLPAGQTVYLPNLGGQITGTYEAPPPTYTQYDYRSPRPGSQMANLYGDTPINFGGSQVPVPTPGSSGWPAWAGGPGIPLGAY